MYDQVHPTLRNLQTLKDRTWFRYSIAGAIGTLDIGPHIGTSYVKIMLSL